jgi:hypothetical protein
MRTACVDPNVAPRVGSMRRMLIAAVLLPATVLAADLEFAGGLERITHDSILIRLADGARINAPLPPKVPKTGALAEATITAQYKLADEVLITCKPMGADHCEELKSIRFLRPPTPKERALVLGSTKPAAPVQPELEHARQVNLDHAANMPNFVADETVKRYTTRKTSPDAWKLVDTIESEITFKGGEPTRQRIRINGKPWNKPIAGINISPEFGTEIKPVFNPECPTQIDFEGRQELRGKQLLVYRFTSASYGCFGYFGYQNTHYVPARTGRVLVEDPGGSMIQYEEEAKEFPKGFLVDSWREVTSWDYVKIGDAPALLPLTNDFFEGLSAGDLWHISVEFSNYRRFEASTNVTFH